MGNRGDSGGSGGGSDAGFENTTKSKLSKKNQKKVESKFRDRGADKIKEGVKGPPSVRIAGAILSGPLQAGSRKTRDFFTDKVLGSKNYKGTSKEDFEKMTYSQQESIYGDYMSGRQSGKTDAYGNQIGTGRDEVQWLQELKKNLLNQLSSLKLHPKWIILVLSQK